MFVDKINFDLDNEIECYPGDGTKQPVNKIVLLAPSFLNIGLAANFKQKIFRAMRQLAPQTNSPVDAAPKEESDQPLKIDGSAYIMLILSSNENYEDFIKAFIELLKKNTAYFEDGGGKLLPLKEVNIHNICNNLPQLERLMGVYCENFLQPQNN